MKTILVTGAGGFIGSHLTEACIRQGYKVKAFVRYNAAYRLGWLEQSPLLKNIEVIAGDIRDFDSVFKAVKGCDTIFHLAALIGIPYSYVSPLAYIKTNVEGTYNVVEAAKDLGVKNVLVTSTSETYGTGQYLPIDEKHPCVGQSPYAASKIAADQIALSYYRSFGLPVKVVRPFNTYGPRQSTRAIIPTIITQLLAGSKVLKLGHLRPTRDLVYVEDTVNDFLAIAKSSRAVGEEINIATGRAISIKDLAGKINVILGSKAVIKEERQRLRPARSEVERLLGDNRKLRRLTAWRPQVGLDTGLKMTIDWFKDPHNRLAYKTTDYHV